MHEPSRPNRADRGNGSEAESTKSMNLCTNVGKSPGHVAESGSTRESFLRTFRPALRTRTQTHLDDLSIRRRHENAKADDRTHDDRLSRIVRV